MLNITKELLCRFYNYDVGNWHVSTIEGNLVWWKQEDGNGNIHYNYDRHYGGTISGAIEIKKGE